MTCLKVEEPGKGVGETGVSPSEEDKEERSDDCQKPRGVWLSSGIEISTIEPEKAAEYLKRF